MCLKEIKKTIDELVEIRNAIAKQPKFMLYKKEIINRLDFSITNLKMQEKDEVYRIYLIEKNK